MQKILFASTNKGKFAEIMEVAAKFPEIKILKPNEISAETPEPEVEESGKTYEANALLKAHAYAAWAKMPVIADDTGLEVAFLDGRPGVYSARYAGEPSDPKKNIEKLLTELGSETNRVARFVCILALVGLTPEPITAMGTFKGHIALAPSGNGGFGYDSVFIPKGESLSLAGLKGSGAELKTHRVAAAEELFRLVSKSLSRKVSI
jgi:XTP/dITP diphosphohydrolase